MNNPNLANKEFIFFGTSRLSVIVLEELAKHGLIPTAIITTPDRPKGRKLILTPPLTKDYAIKNNIPVYQFEKLDNTAIEQIKSISKNSAFFLVASYGLIIPKDILDIPSFGTINIHPSLLPKYRGATPLQQALLDDAKNTGITIMLMDEKMDHGPILIQENRLNKIWPLSYDDLEEELAILAAKILSRNIDKILNKEITPTPQNHELATFTKKIKKESGEININKLSGDDGYKQFLKFCAYKTWPTTFFFVEKTHKSNTTNVNQTKKLRVKITDANWDNLNNTMEILKVIPEGQKPISYNEFIKKI